jgi:NADH-quinone oxidoreductase subunit A
MAANGCGGARYAARGGGGAVDGYLGSYASLALLLGVGVAFVGVAMTANRVLRPHRPTAAKLSTYECGVDPVGGDWAQSQIRYYVYAYLYVLFAVESVFLFPWATIFDDPGFGLTTVVEMGVFVALIALGLLYAWRKGVLSWL